MWGATGSKRATAVASKARFATGAWSECTLVRTRRSGEEFKGDLQFVEDIVGVSLSTATACPIFHGPCLVEQEIKQEISQGEGIRGQQHAAHLSLSSHRSRFAKEGGAAEAGEGKAHLQGEEGVEIGKP